MSNTSTQDDLKKTGVVVATDVEKTFRDFWRRPKVRAVDGISLNIAQGEVFGLLGPNGSGKSTTLKMILGLLKPTKGTISVLGKSPSKVRTKSRIGYMPEESYLYKYLSARETLDFYGKLFDLDDKTRKQRTEELLEMSGLTHAGKRHIGEYSKGMARRIGLAQTLINDPDFIVLDEPTSGLDPIGCRQVKDLIIGLAQRGKTVLLASHLLADVEDVCDRIAILYDGRIQTCGPVKDLLENKDAVRITMDSLTPDALKKVLAAVREEIGNEPDIDYPSKNLEQFFVEVVKKARETSGDSSGVAESSGIANFLTASNGSNAVGKQV